MAVPMDHYDSRMGTETPLIATPNWTINVSDVRVTNLLTSHKIRLVYKIGVKTLKVSNISLAATEQDIREFFSYSGDVQYLEMQRESEISQVAYVTFKDSQGADRAMLLSGATIVNLSVNISPVENYQLPPSAFPHHSERRYPAAADSAVVKKAEDVVSSMLAKGFILGKDALNKAKALDERHHLISNASATVASLDRRMGIREKLIVGGAVVNEKVKEVDERYQIFEKTKSALVAAEQKASSAGSALMSNPFVSTAASWVSSALSMIAKAAEDVTIMTKDKVERAEDRDIICSVRTGGINLDEQHVVMAGGECQTVTIECKEDSQFGII